MVTFIASLVLATSNGNKCINRCNGTQSCLKQEKLLRAKDLASGLAVTKNLPMNFSSDRDMERMKTNI